MRRLLSVLSLTFVMPLAACFDVDINVDFPDADNVEMTMVMTSSPEFYAMSSSSGDDLCEDGEGVVQDDGSYVCTMTETETVDKIIADMALDPAELDDDAMANGFSVERRDNGQIFASFDLSELTDEMQPPGDDDMSDEEAAQMEAALLEAFAGHAISISVSGAEIIETNGTISDDGKSAFFSIPLTVMFDDELDLPETFEVLLVPGT